MYKINLKTFKYNKNKSKYCIDKECPLFNQASISEAITSNASSNGSSTNKKTHKLIKQMRADGLELKKSAASTKQQISFTVSY